MGYRSKWNTELYDDSMKVEFHLRTEDFILLIEEGNKMGITADEYVKRICIELIKES